MTEQPGPSMVMGILDGKVARGPTSKTMPDLPRPARGHGCSVAF